MKKIVTTLFIIAFSFPTFSQGTFQWAKSYMGAEAVFSTPTSTTNRIYHTEFDSQGNSYILGVYGQGASLNDTDLLGLAFGGATTSILVMKLDPNGNIVWKKSIKNSSANSNYPNWMKLVGDTSLVVATVLDLATYNIDLWYLDTLIAPGSYEPNPNYPFPYYNGGNNIYTSGNAFITFDLNGNIVNQHFLQIAYLDSLGTWIEDMGTSNFTPNGVVSPFHIDNSGNIYICSQLNKLYPPTALYTSESFRLIIDGQRTIDFGMKYRNNSKIFKFSPNFNELIWSRDLMMDTTEIGEYTQLESLPPSITGIASDSIGNIYVCGHIYHERNGYPYVGDTTYYRKIYIDTNNRFHTIEIEPGAGNVGFIIKYDTFGNVLWTNQLHGYTQFVGNENHGYVLGFGSQFHNLAINEDNNSVYVIAEMYAGGVDTNSYIIFHDTITYRSHAENISFIRYNKNNGDYISHGIAYSQGGGTLNGGTITHIAYGFGTIPFVVRNNQVFTQVIYRNTIIGFDTVIHASNNGYNGSGLALIRWREDGGLIEVLNFPINSQNQRMVAGGLTMSNNGEAALFGCVDNEINLGPFTIGQGSAGNSRAFIAIYSDPTFNQPYEGEVYFYVPDSIPDTLNLISNISNLSNDQLFLYPNPTKDEVYITSKGEMINSYSLYNTNGQLLLRSEKLKTKREKLNLSNFSKGVYVIKVITDKNSYTRKVIRN